MLQSQTDLVLQDGGMTSVVFLSHAVDSLPFGQIDECEVHIACFGA